MDEEKAGSRTVPGDVTARTGVAAGRAAQAPHRYEVRPVAWVESPLKHRAQAPRQGSEGAPPAWLVFEPELAEAVRDLRAGEQVIVLTWLMRTSSTSRQRPASRIDGSCPGAPWPDDLRVSTAGDSSRLLLIASGVCTAAVGAAARSGVVVLVGDDA